MQKRFHGLHANTRQHPQDVAPRFGTPGTSIKCSDYGRWWPVIEVTGHTVKSGGSGIRGWHHITGGNVTFGLSLTKMPNAPCTGNSFVTTQTKVEGALMHSWISPKTGIGGGVRRTQAGIREKNQLIVFDAILDRGLSTPRLLTAATPKYHVPEVRFSTTYVLIEALLTEIALSSASALRP